MSDKLFIKNRKGQKVCVLLDILSDSKGIAFVMHGLGGSKDQKHVQIFSNSFIGSNISVVRFDTTNTFGESDGNYENATTTNYYEDLEDVVNWSKTQEWYKQPFFLCGHSLGGISTVLYCEKHPNEVKGLVPISTVISGKLSLETSRYKNNDILKNWKQSGWKEEKRQAHPGKVKKIKWGHMEDRLKYDILKDVDKLKMPVLMIVGSDDESTPVEHQKLLFEKLNSDKEMYFIKGAPHTFRDSKHLDEIGNIMSTWIKNHL